jgi:excisionase family DNA binding protein
MNLKRQEELGSLNGASSEMEVLSTRERLLTSQEVATWLGVSKAWVYDHTTRKRPLLPCVRLGEMTRFRITEVEQFILQHAKRAANE